MASFLAAGSNAAAKRSAGTALCRCCGLAAASTAPRRREGVREVGTDHVRWDRTCTVLAAYNLSKGHRDFPDPPPYPYLHIRKKDFPWGSDGLFKRKKKHSNQGRREGGLEEAWHP